MKEYSNLIMVQLANGNIIELSAWQKNQGLKAHQIGRYFSYMESRFIKDMEDYGSLIVNAPLMVLLDAFREEAKRPVSINSFNRSDAKQKELAERGFKTAKFSPHVVKMAADIDTTSEEQTLKEVKILESLSHELDMPIRIGALQYLRNGQTFIHVDVCPMYYSKGAPFHKEEHPWQWEKEARW